jgi:hypothetical protein
MKIILAAVLAAFAFGSLATAAQADAFRDHHHHPMKVCTMMHHHRVCHMR